MNFSIDSYRHPFRNASKNLFRDCLRLEIPGGISVQILLPMPVGNSPEIPVDFFTENIARILSKNHAAIPSGSYAGNFFFRNS